MDRRKFLKLIAGSLGSAALGSLGFGCLGTPDVFRRAEGPPPSAPEVGIALFQEESLAVRAVQEALDLIGGVERLVRPGDRVVIKPNLVDMNRIGDDPIKGEVTNPKVVEGVIEAVKDARGIPVVAEGSAGRTTKLFAERIGLLDVCRRTGADFVDLNNDDVVRLEVPNPLVLDEVRVARTAVECDRFISVPVMKTHYYAGVTLGMKNLVGILSPKFYMMSRPYDRFGFHHIAKHNWRAKYGDRTEDYGPHLWYLPLSAAIADLNSARKPDLVVLDGTFGRERQSPLYGPLVDLRRRAGSYMVIASFDPVAADAFGVWVMRQPVEKIPQLRFAEAKGLGISDVSKIALKGASLSDVAAPFVSPYPMLGG